MSQNSKNTLLSVKIRKQLRSLQATGLILLSLAQGIPSLALAEDTAAPENAAISIILNKDIQLQDSSNPSRSIGTLTHGSRVTLAIPASVATTLNGKTTLSNDDLSELLGKLGGKNTTSGTGRSRRTTTYQQIAINRNEQFSTVDPKISAASLNLKDLLKSDSLSLQPVQYNVASIATGPGISMIRDAASRPVPEGYRDPQLTTTRETSATRTQAQANCVECDQARANRRTRSETANMNQLRAVGESVPRVPTPAARPVAISAPQSGRFNDMGNWRPPGRRGPWPSRFDRVEMRAPHTESLAEYSNSPAVEKMIAYAIKNSTAKTRKYCYRFVKFALYAGGLSNFNSLDGRVNASGGANDLARQGWTNLASRNPSLLTNPYKAPVGSVVVYRDIYGGAGHIEIRTKTGFVSDYRGPASPYGRQFKIIGVMVPPGVQAE